MWTPQHIITHVAPTTLATRTDLDDLIPLAECADPPIAYGLTDILWMNNQLGDMWLVNGVLNPAISLNMSHIGSLAYVILHSSHQPHVARAKTLLIACCQRLSVQQAPNPNSLVDAIMWT
jgi:hypothetical protein